MRGPYKGKIMVRTYHYPKIFTFSKNILVEIVGSKLADSDSVNLKDIAIDVKK